MTRDVENGVYSIQGSRMESLKWNAMLIVGVVFYASYTVLMHLCEEGGRLPFSSASMNLLIELTKLSLCIVFLARSRLGMRAVQHLFWMALHPRLTAPYAVPAFLYFVNCNVCVHMQLQMDPITYQICICAVVLAPAVYRGDAVTPELTCRCVAPFSVPALLYFINNNLAVQMQVEMDPATYQVLGNFKILTTAVLYRVIIKRPISRIQSVALFLLLLAGISNSYGGFVSESKPVTGNLYITAKGILMILSYCVISGLAGVYSEYIFKNKYEMSIYVQSGLLYMFGSAFNAATWMYGAWSGDHSWDLLEGFTWPTWAVVLTQAFVGLTMGAVMKHGSNITRLFLISTAMLLTTLLSVAVFGLQLNIFFTAAFLLVSIALVLYHNVLNIKI